MQDGIQLPDPQARRSAALLVLIIAVLGAVAFVSIDLYVDNLTELAREDADEALQSLVYTLKVLAVGIGFLLVALAAWLSALSGKIAFTYSIANFPTRRCLEQIRNDAAYHDADVKVVSIGGGFSYGALGMSHHATEDLAIMRAIPAITVFSPGYYST